MCTPTRKFDRITSILLGVGLLSIFCALNFFHHNDNGRGFIAGFGVGIELVALVRIALIRRST